MKNWQIKKMRDICDQFSDGDWVEKKDQSISGIRLIQTGNVGSGYFKDRGEKSRYISKETFTRLRCTEIFSGDCLISRLPDPVGRACVLPDTDKRMITAVDCAIVRFSAQKIISEWFVYFSLSQQYQNAINESVSGSTRQRISRAKLGEIQIPLPPLPEQHRIVKILDEAFEAIEKTNENAEKNLRNARQVRSSYLEELFSPSYTLWQRKKISDIGTVQTGTTPKTSEKKNFGKFVPFVKPANFQADGSLFYDGDGLSEQGLMQSRKVDKGSILMVCIGATIGKTGYTDRVVTFNQQINSLTPLSDIDTKFLYYQMISSSFQKAVILSSGQATLPIINKSKWSRLALFIPALSEQRSIVARLDVLSAETKKLEAIYQRKIVCLEELKKSLLKKAFAGEL